jgi:hypothetical protein
MRGSLTDGGMDSKDGRQPDGRESDGQQNGRQPAIR